MSEQNQTVARRTSDDRLLLIELIIKLVSCGLIAVSWWVKIDLFAPQVTLTAFILVMFIESTILISSISPFALLSILYAHALILQGAISAVAIGYFAALAGNVVSYLAGRSLSTNADPIPAHQAQHWRLAATFWHPQLAAISAFQAGLAHTPTATYMLAAIPVSAAYYALAVVLISQFAKTLPHQFPDGLLLAILGVWLMVDALRLLRRRRARR
jgi:hypothetical protein